MGKPVRIAELKAHLSATLRRVRRGETVTILDRDTPIAKIVRIDAPGGTGLQVRPARGNWRDVKLPPPLETTTDIIELLLEERGDR